MASKITLTLVVATALLSSGCTFAKYSKLRVQVVDERTQAGIPGARVSTIYVKPGMDFTYQRNDSEKTDGHGFATLTVATNSSQRMIFGWTYGIFPHLTVKAHGYHPQVAGDELFGIPLDQFGRAEPLLIQMTSSNSPSL